MSIYEIKSAFISLLAEVDDPELLRRMLENCVELFNQADGLEDLPSEVMNALEAADLDDDLSDTIPNEAVFQQLQTWQKR